MSDPLSGYAAATFTLSQLKALTAGTAGSSTAFLAQATKLAAQHGVTAAEFLNSLRTTTTVGGQIGSLAETALAIAKGHGVTAAVLEAEIAAAGAAGAGAAGGAAGAGGAGAGGAALSGTALAVGGLIVAGLLGAIGYTGYQAYSANAEADAAEQRAQSTTDMRDVVRDTDDNSVSGETYAPAGYVLVQVQNHPNKAVSIRAADAVAKHNSGETQLRLCNFLHGGRCGGDVVDTPNGPVTIGESEVASLSVLGEYPDYQSASNAMCAQLTNVAANNLAEGFSGDFGGDRVTIDAGGGSSPC